MVARARAAQAECARPPHNIPSDIDKVVGVGNRFGRIDPCPRQLFFSISMLTKGCVEARQPHPRRASAAHTTPGRHSELHNTTEPDRNNSFITNKVSNTSLFCLQFLLYSLSSHAIFACYHACRRTQRSPVSPH